MASQSRRADPPLEQILFEEGYRFDFFQAVRVLERLHPDRHSVGRDGIPSKEVVRFRSHLSLTFPPSSVHEIIRSLDETEPAEMVVAFMGLTGPMGVLPRHYTELLLERVRHKDFALRDFFDIINHRVISLFYRAWEKYRFPIAYERTRSQNNDYDPFSIDLFHLIGMGTKGLRGRLAIDDEALLFYAGLMAQQPRSASALEAILKDYFGVPVTVKQFVGAWLHLTNENCSRLRSGDANSRLGTSAILGSRFWDQQAGFRIRIGPLTFRQFCQFLPSGKAFKLLVELNRYFVGLTLDFDVQLILKEAEVPSCQLRKPGPDALKLGWSSWLKSREFVHDAEDAVLGSHLTRIEASPYKWASKKEREAKNERQP